MRTSEAQRGPGLAAQTMSHGASRALKAWRRRLVRASRTLYAGPVLPPRPFHLWLVVGMLAAGVALHYGDHLPLLSEAADRSPADLPTRQSVERILFLLPIVYATLA